MGTWGWYGQHSSCGYYGRFLKKPASASPRDREGSTWKGWRTISQLWLTLSLCHSLSPHCHSSLRHDPDLTLNLAHMFSGVVNPR